MTAATNDTDTVILRTSFNKYADYQKTNIGKKVHGKNGHGKKVHGKKVHGKLVY